MSLLALFTTRQTRVGLIASALLGSALVAMRVQPLGYDFNDAHLYVADYLQPRTSLRRFLELLGAKGGRAALIAVPVEPVRSLRLQPNRADAGPAPSDSFTDAWIATVYKSLTVELQARFDPMITGFSPADVYAPDHIRRVLETFPGVFTGIAMGSPAAGLSSSDRAFDRVLDFAATVGLTVLVGNNRPGDGDSIDDLNQLVTQLKGHPHTTIILAHSGAIQHAADVERILADPELRNIYFDVSSKQDGAPVTLITRFPDRFLFGTDEIAQSAGSDYLRASKLSDPSWLSLSPATASKIRKLNYERIFDHARQSVRAWEKAHLPYPQ